MPRVFVLTLLAHAVLLAQGSPAVETGWYNGDCQMGIGGPANYVSDRQFVRVYDNFAVPDGGWTVTGAFSDNSMSFTNVSEAVWEIRGGISAGNGGLIVASGRSPAKQTLLLTWPDGQNLYRVQVDGLRVRLAAGAYWLSVTPVVDSAFHTQSFLCATRGANAVGSPRGNDAQAFLYASGPPGILFQPAQSSGQLGTSGDFSQGVLISTSSVLPPPPSIVSVVSAASWQAGPVAPGEIVTIQGTGLGPPAASALMMDDAGKVSTTLNGVLVLFNGVAAPETYVGGSQINAVVPYEVAGASSLVLQVFVGGQPSNEFSLAAAAAAPALFTANGSGTGPAAILNQDSTYNGPANPAPKGSYVVLYLTGEGRTTSPVTGKITILSSVAPVTPQPLLPVAVSIGGQPAAVSFYGEAPGLVSGVLQVNVQIPAAAGSGNVPLSVSVGPDSTPSGVTIFVK